MDTLAVLSLTDLEPEVIIHTEKTISGRTQPIGKDVRSCCVISQIGVK